jgi:hypothetical protein
MAKKTSKKSSKKSAPKKSAAAPKLSLDTASVAELERALAARKRGSAKLLSKRARVAAQLADIDAELAALGIRPDGGTVAVSGGGGGSRPRNDKTLPEAMAAVMKGKELRVRDIADAVLASGYRSSSANFTTIVSQALGRETKTFKKVSRGVYTAK